TRFSGSYVIQDVVMPRFVTKDDLTLLIVFRLEDDRLDMRRVLFQAVGGSPAIRHEASPPELRLPVVHLPCPRQWVTYPGVGFAQRPSRSYLRIRSTPVRVSLHRAMTRRQ